MKTKGAISIPGIRGGERSSETGAKPYDGGAAASPLRQARVFKASAAAWAARSGKPGRRATGSRRRYVPGSVYDPVCYLFDDTPPPPPEMRMVHAGRFPANLREESHEEYPGQWVPIEEATEKLGTALEELVTILRQRRFAGTARYRGRVCIERPVLGKITKARAGAARRATAAKSMHKPELPNGDVLVLSGTNLRKPPKA